MTIFTVRGSVSSMICQRCEEEATLTAMVWGPEDEGRVYCIKCALLQTKVFDEETANKLSDTYIEKHRRDNEQPS